MSESVPVTREEMNRLWGDIAALHILIAQDIGHRWGADRVRAWHDKAVHAHEATIADAAISANMVRALDKLAERLLRATNQSSS